MDDGVKAGISAAIADSFKLMAITLHNPASIHNGFSF